MYANVIVDISHEKLDKTFQYSIPDEILCDIRPGVCVDGKPLDYRKVVVKVSLDLL